MTGRKTCLGDHAGLSYTQGNVRYDVGVKSPRHHIYLIITLLTFTFEMIKYVGEKKLQA